MKKSFEMIVFYDNWCPMCKNIKKNIDRIDWLNLITMIGFRGREKELGIPPKNLDREMHAIILRSNKIVSGFDAFVSISLRIPLLFFFWPLLMFFNIIGIGSKVYKVIAKRRNIVPTGHCNENKCSIKK